MLLPLRLGDKTHGVSFICDSGNGFITSAILTNRIRFPVTRTQFGGFVYQVYRDEMRISDNRWCTRAVYDTTPFCYVINKCQTRASDKLEKCVHSVVLLCSICISNKELTVLILYFHLKKTVAELYRLLREAYGEHASSQDACEL